MGIAGANNGSFSAQRFRRRDPLFDFDRAILLSCAALERPTPDTRDDIESAHDPLYYLSRAPLLIQ